MAHKISVIVPVYSVEKYLPYCIESIYNQTINNFELVLVDDGSPDNSGNICDDYANIHDNTIVVHQDNQGLSAARNNGVKASSGEYVTFVDSDDVVSPDYLETLYSIITEYNADISVGLLVPFWGEGFAVSKLKRKHSINVYGTEQALEEMLYAQKYGVQGPCKLYKRCLVENEPFPLGKLHEDQAAMYKIVAKSNRLVYIDKPIYFYRQRRTSIVHTRITKEHLYGLDAVKEQMDFIKNNYPRIIDAAAVRFAIVICKWIPGLQKGTYEDKEMFEYLRAELMPYYSIIMNNKRVTRALKSRVFSIKMGFYPSKYVFMLIEKMRIRKSKARVYS